MRYSSSSFIVITTCFKLGFSSRYRGYYMAARGYEFYLRVLKVPLTISEEILSALEDKLRIPARPCNVLFCFFCEPFLSKQPTIFRWQKLGRILCLTHCDPRFRKVEKSDQYQYLGNFPPTPPLTQR